MKYVDRIIRYLSGELSEDDTRSFQHELGENSVLRDEYEQVSAAYRLIGDQLQKEDLDHFRSRLREVLEKPVNDRKAEKRIRIRKKDWLFLVPLAASLAVLIALWYSGRKEDRIFSKFYRPEADPVVLACSQDPRGEAEMGIVLYNQEQYMRSRSIMKELLRENPENQLALLYFLLTSIELDLEKEAVGAAEEAFIVTDHPLGQSLAWYTGMAYVKNGQYEDAVAVLAPMQDQSGPYGPKAKRLIKLLQRRTSSP